jgi:hypothetical protein
VPEQPELSDFEAADAEAGAQSVQRAVAVRDSGRPRAPGNMIEHRANLISEYHKGAAGLADRLKAEGRDKPGMLVMALVEEVVKETDSLLGNELIATENGELRDATVISSKRTEALEKAIRAVQSKQMLDQQGSVDPDGPAMRAVFRFFMKKVKAVFERMGAADELSDAFFRHLGDSTQGWQKELAAELEDLRSLRPGATDA